MKKILLTLIICFLSLHSFSALANENEITVTVNGEVLSTPISAEIVNNRTMLPMRSIFESLGADVTWFEKDRIIFATNDNTLITLKIDVPVMSVQTVDSEGNSSVELDTAPFIYNNYTLVSARAVAEALDARVEWVAETKTVVITTDSGEVEE